MIGNRKLDMARAITHLLPLDRANEAFACAQNRQESGAVFIVVEME